MSATRRRFGGALAAILVIAIAFAYAAWRLSVVGQEGWAGLTYYPDVPKMAKKGRPQPPVAVFRPGSIVMIYPDSPAERAGLQRSDRIVAIGGIPLPELEAIDKLGHRVHHGDTIVYRVERGGAVRDVPVRFGSPANSIVFLGLFGVTCVVALVYLVIGLFVFWRRPRDARAVIFFAMTLCAASAFFNASLLQVEGMSSRGFALVHFTVAQIARPLALAGASIFFAPLLLHLALIFPRRRPVVARGRTLWQWIYGYPLFVIGAGAVLGSLLSGIAKLEELHRASNIKVLFFGFCAVLALIGIAGMVRLILSIRRNGLREGIFSRPFATMATASLLLISLCVVVSFAAHRRSPMITVVLGMILAFGVIGSFASYPVATFIALFRSYREAGIEERRQLKWPLWGTMIAVGGRAFLYVIGIAISFMITFGSNSIPNAVFMGPEVVAKVLYLLIPVSFAFAILKYRLMNIDVIIRRTVLYTILSAVVLVIYIALVAGVGTLVVHFTAVKSQTMIVASTIVVGLMTIPLRNKLQGMVDRNLFRERRDYALALRNISSAIGGGDLHIFLQKAAEEVQQAVQTRFVLIALRSATHYGAAAKVGIADEILRTLEIPIADLPEETPERTPALQRLGTALVLPLREHGETLGFLALGTKLSDQELGIDDIQFLGAAAQQIALGIENVRLRSEEADFAQARTMQQILLPTSFPKLEGYGISGMWQPARSVGGDYFDTISIGEGKVAVCIADVAGKGMPAALLMANLQAAVKATAGPDVAPAQLCERVKRVVTGNLAGGTFITFFYGIVDAATRTFAYSNAGHNPPIVVRADGSIERLSTGGSAFGRLFREERHIGDSIPLRSGDRVVLFTDGASESRRGDEEFSEERLASVIAANRHLPAHALQNAIASAIATFSGGNLDDDLTLVVVAAE